MVDTGVKKHSGRKRLAPLAKVYTLTTHQSQYPNAGVQGFSQGIKPEPSLWALLHHAIFLQEKKIKGTQVQAGLSSPHSSFKFILNSLCSPPGTHYPAKDARVRLRPLQRQIRAHPPWSHNKPPLSFPFLQSKVAFKRRNSLRFCLPNSEGPKGKVCGNKAASSP